MLIIWTEVLNSLTMFSPLLAWIKNMKKHKKTFMHKLQIVHIPISITFHAFCAVSSNSPLKNIFRITDLTLIHVYGLVASRDIRYAKKLKSKELQNTLACKTIQTVTLMLNTYCIVSIINNRHSDIVRILGLGMCGYDKLQDPNIKSLVPLGFVSCLLYLIDGKLHGLGHPTFHVLLGFLQHKLFMCLEN